MEPIYEVKIERDSINEFGNRLTTFVCTYQRFIHSELMTHRMFSRNAASSRAIPVKKMIEKIRKTPAMPIHWGASQSGMQANNEIENIDAAKNLWVLSADSAVEWAEKMLKLGLHKQVVNRILEPYAYMTTIITATEFGNFFNLRAHPDAQPEFQHLAYEMADRYNNSIPEQKYAGEWHLPFIQDDEFKMPLDVLKKVSTARCARVSYLTHDGKRDIEEDIKLYDRLVASFPVHASPGEHLAEALGEPERVGNFIGWKQHRKELNEYFPIYGKVN